MDRIQTAYRLCFPHGIQEVRGYIQPNDPKVFVQEGSETEPESPIMDGWYLDFSEAQRVAKRARERIMRRLRRDLKRMEKMNLEEPIR